MTTATVALAMLLAVAGQTARSMSPSPTIIFVCEHGAAKSLIAAAYFNKLAAERGMKERATFRGVSPQDALSTMALEGLRADGVPVPEGNPRQSGRTT